MTTQEKLNETWEYCHKQFGMTRCIALTLHGSQNYGLSLPDSDVDAKLIIAPTWDEVINCSQPLSKTIPGPYGDINVTDVRLFIGNCLRKQNFNFIECLFTEYNCVNKLYEDLWSQLFTNREAIAHYKPELAVKTMVGQAHNQYSRWNRFDNKKTLYHMLRIHWAIITYIYGLPFAYTLRPDENENALIMSVRLGEIGQEEMEKMFEEAYADILKLEPLAATVVDRELEANWVMETVQEEMVKRALYELADF